MTYAVSFLIPPLGYVFSIIAFHRERVGGGFALLLTAQAGFGFWGAIVFLALVVAGTS